MARSLRRRSLIGTWLLAAIAAATLAPLVAPPVASATTAHTVGQLSLVSTVTSVTYGWQRAQVWSDTDPTWPAEHYLPTGRDNQTGQPERLFGTPQPPGSQFILFQAPGATTNSGPPVLLVMGAGDSVTREYADPNLGGAYTCGTAVCPSTGLMQYLSGEGYRVFAVDFANIQGNNFEWAQTISDALQVVRDETSTSSVDLVAWSKGAFAARMYVSSVAPSWGRPYQGDVSKLVLIGNPNGGLDYTFAHGTEGNPEIYPQCGGSLNGPSPSQSYMCYGVMYTEPDLSIDSAYWTGQRQMLARWDGTYGVDETQDTWYTTYYGGTGYTSTSNGIQYAIDHGSLVSTVQNAGIPASVPTYLLCGGAPTIPGFYNENRGPSDGVVFIASCEDTTGIGNLAAVTLFSGYNHLMLGWEPTAEATISGWLS
ncbi:MAG: lipase [Actinomycetota bacterium]|nr:lipase [Actinomycetota bacterium]